ncbi:hypothetical protein SK128_003796 [Halocaridina rubra]|uniref:NACHT domain-containing protein n=1 Tax=Halocaridina rubra TaxID=373956 RepID=A0AAN9A1Z8_HALRR
MAKNSTVISEYKTIFHKYDDCVKIVAAREILRVIKWLYKGGDMYVGDYMKYVYDSKQHSTGKEKKRRNNAIEDILEDKKPLEDMDISDLYLIVRYTCGLEEPESKIWYDPPDSEKERLEHTFYLLKEMRNELSHEDSRLRKLSDCEMTEKMDSVKKLCVRLLIKAGERSGKMQEAAAAIYEMEKDLHSLIGITPEEFATLAKKEIKHRGYENVEWYSSPLLYHGKHLLSVSDLLKLEIQDHSKSQVIIVTGDAGTGKTTLCQYLVWLWGEAKDEILELKAYKLAMLIKCRDVCTRNVTSLLCDDLLPDTTSWCNPSDIKKHLKSIRILWVIDGLEESTAEATAVICNLKNKQNPNHTLLITSRPEHSYSLKAMMHQSEYVEISLQGIKPLEMLEQLITDESISPYSSLEMKQFAENFRKLNKDLQHELQNPLKLCLAMQVWKNNINNIGNASNLRNLYKTIKNNLIESLAQKLAIGKLSKKDAECKVNEWFHYLCKIAFEMVASKIVAEINAESLERLKKNCLSLLIESPDMCLSTFLAHSGSGVYRFFHSTQQYFYAALYGASVFLKSQDLAHTLKVFGILPSQANVINLDHFYEVLLLILSNKHEVISKKKAKELIQLFSYAIKGEFASIKWFEVIENACHRRKFATPAIDFIPDPWIVSDRHISACNQLLDLKKPSRICIQVTGNPMEILDLGSLLKKLSIHEKATYIELYLDYHFKTLRNADKSDEYLKNLLSDSSQCCLLGFSGQLSSDGYKLLNNPNIQDYCNTLRLKIKSYDCLSMLHHQVHLFQTLERITLTFDFIRYRPVYIKSQLPTCMIDLYLPNIFDSHVESAVATISSLSKTYETIILKNISQKGVSRFVASLKRKDVQAQALLRFILDQSGVRGYYVNFGPLPLPYNENELQKQWVNSEKMHRLQRYNS